MFFRIYSVDNPRIPPPSGPKNPSGSQNRYQEYCENVPSARRLRPFSSRSAMAFLWTKQRDSKVRRERESLMMRAKGKILEALGRKGLHGTASNPFICLKLEHHLCTHVFALPNPRTSEPEPQAGASNSSPSKTPSRSSLHSNPVSHG